MTRLFLVGFLTLSFLTPSLSAAELATQLRRAGISAGVVVVLGEQLPALDDRYHVCLLTRDAAAQERLQRQALDAGRAGRVTVHRWDGQRIPFATRTVNALISGDRTVAEAEIERVLAPRGLHISSSGVTVQPVPETIDDWSHYLYDASGNAVSHDEEVATPKGFRWWAEPRHMRSHNFGASFHGLVTSQGHLFYFKDDSPYVFDQGGIDDNWMIYARDAFNGALLWKRPLHGYDQTAFEDVSGQARAGHVWSTPLSLNRRLVGAGDLVVVATHYREGPMGILDAATGETMHEVDLGGVVDEIIVEGHTAWCRVRPEIPEPQYDVPTRQKIQNEKRQQGLKGQDVHRAPDRMITRQMLNATGEQVVAVDIRTGAVTWRHAAGSIATQCLAAADGLVVYYDYQGLQALDAGTGEPRWRFKLPINADKKYWALRNLTGNLLLAEGKVLWTGATTGGYCLDLQSGELLWDNPRLRATGGFGFPTARRVIDGHIYDDYVTDGRPLLKLADGSEGRALQIGGMLKRGHHIRCFPGKATVNYLITPERGAEFIDLDGDDHMVNDWLRGACSLGNLPANGLFYVTPDPCACYAGARIYGFTALSPRNELADADPAAPDAVTRISTGSAAAPTSLPEQLSATADAWPIYRADARRLGRAHTSLSPTLNLAWQTSAGSTITPNTIADGRVFVADRDDYLLRCLDLDSGALLWQRPFPAELDGPPTLVGDYAFIGCRDGSVWSLEAASGAVAWRFQAAPLASLTIDGDRLASVWPVSSSLIYQGGLLYAVAGRLSYLDGGIHVYALDPNSGAVQHHKLLEGPWLTKEDVAAPVIPEYEWINAERKGPDALAKVRAASNAQYASGYNIKGAEADILVADDKGALYMTQTKLTPRLEHVDLQRDHYMGKIPFGGMRITPSTGFLDTTFFHRSFWMYDEIWPGMASGPGFGARAGNLVVVGQERAYAAKHYELGRYAKHKPGSGNRLVADDLEQRNTTGDQLDPETARRLGVYRNSTEIVRTKEPLWESRSPLIIRALICAPDGQGGELVISAGVVEGTTKKQWEQSTRYQGPAKLQIHNGADGQLLAAYDLPAVPVFDGMSAADGKIVLSLVDGRVVCFTAADAAR